MFSESQKDSIVFEYMSGKSTAVVGSIFGITAASVSNLLKSKGIPLRTISEGNALKWKDAAFRENQVAKRIGKPSGALGKTWEVEGIVRKPNLVGSKNPNWKGGKTKLSIVIRSLPEYAVWRMDIFKRDRWTCQICGAKNGEGVKFIFHADHIKPLSKIIEENSVMDSEEAVSCEQIWDTKNGRCLCKECHKKTETWGMNQYKK